MRVVLDTNVLVSGLLTPFGQPAAILRLLLLGKITICLDARILSEYSEVLSRPKFQFKQETLEFLLKELELLGEFVTGIPFNGVLPDADDQMFIEVALGGHAECLITGNLDHFPKKRVADVRILSPVGFLKYFKKSEE